VISRDIDLPAGAGLSERLTFATEMHRLRRLRSRPVDDGGLNILPLWACSAMWQCAIQARVRDVEENVDRLPCPVVHLPLEPVGRVVLVRVTVIDTGVVGVDVSGGGSASPCDALRTHPLGLAAARTEEAVKVYGRGATEVRALG
jgi:hypothetical protein